MWDAARELIRHNVEQVRATGAKRLVVTCPSCFQMWQTYYPRVLSAPLNLEVMHSIQYLTELVDRDKIQFRDWNVSVTYHDPCDLGRIGRVFDEPRHLLRHVPGLTLIEMQDHHEMALCCGGGGNLETARPELAHLVAGKRLDQARATRAEVIISACQQCERTLIAAGRKINARMPVKDIAEVVQNLMRTSD
jgi:heterodisulfide reductase subunit D